MGGHLRRPRRSVRRISGHRHGHWVGRHRCQLGRPPVPSDGHRSAAADAPAGAGSRRCGRSTGSDPPHGSPLPVPGDAPVARPRDRDVVVDRRIAADAVSRDPGRRAAGGSTAGDKRVRANPAAAPSTVPRRHRGHRGGGLADSAGRAVGQLGVVRRTRLLRHRHGGDRGRRRCQPRDLVPVLQHQGQDPGRADPPSGRRDRGARRRPAGHGRRIR